MGLARAYCHVVALVLAVLAGASGRVLAQASLPDISALNGFVYDPTGALQGQGNAIDARLKLLSDETVAQGAVYVLPSIGEEVPKDFAVELFEHLELGERGTDYGFLVLIVLDQRRAEIEVGYGAEAFLSDVACKRLLDREFVPRARAGQIGAGALELAGALDERLRRGLAGEDPASLVPDAAPRRPFRLPEWLAIYLSINFLFHVGLGMYLYFVYQDRVPHYDKWVRVRGVSWKWFSILFPVPYPLIRLALKRWLKRLRTAPRFHPETHEPMALLDDYEEIGFLTEGMLTEQEVESAEWDVWATPDREHTLLLRYARRWDGYDRCPECDYETYKRSSSRVVSAATYSSSGLREDTYTCRSCEYVKKERRTIPQKQRSSSSGGGSSYSGGGSGGSYSGGGGSSGGGGAGASW